MKKIVLFTLAVAAFLRLNAQCNELFFSEYVEGWDNNKALEIFNPSGNPIILSNYRIVRWDNGHDDSDTMIQYVQPLSGTLAAHATFVCFLDRRNSAGVSADTIMYADMLAYANTLVNSGNAAFFSPDYNANVDGARVLAFNGDDAFSLQKKNGSIWTNVDIFGKIGERPVNYQGGTNPAGGWTDTPPYYTGLGKYLSRDHTLIRKASVENGITANPASFYALADWDSLPVNTYDHLGSHTCNCPLSVQEIKRPPAVIVFPNPVFNGNLQIKVNEKVNFLEIIDLLGQVVYSAKSPHIDNIIIINTDGFKKGAYFLRVALGNGAIQTIKIFI